MKFEMFRSTSHLFLRWIEAMAESIAKMDGDHGRTGASGSATDVAYAYVAYRRLYKSLYPWRTHKRCSGGSRNVG